MILRHDDGGRCLLLPPLLGTFDRRVCSTTATILGQHWQCTPASGNGLRAMSEEEGGLRGPLPLRKVKKAMRCNAMIWVILGSISV